MSNFVNKIKKDGIEYEVHDSRMPTIPTGGTKLYMHQITITYGDEHAPTTAIFLGVCTRSDELTELTYAKLSDINWLCCNVTIQNSICQMTCPFPGATFVSIIYLFNDDNDGFIKRESTTITISKIYSISDTVTEF